MSQKRKSLFLRWMYLVTDINNSLPNLPALACPNCYRLGVDFQYVGDLQTRIGYMVIWCPSCLQGIHISRVGIPDQAQTLCFNASAEQILKRIPNFTHIQRFRLLCNIVFSLPLSYHRFQLLGCTS